MHVPQSVNHFASFMYRTFTAEISTACTRLPRYVALPSGRMPLFSSGCSAMRAKADDRNAATTTRTTAAMTAALHITRRRRRAGLK
jgi:hypothetical protein